MQSAVCRCTERSLPLRSAQDAVEQISGPDLSGACQARFQQVGQQKLSQEVLPEMHPSERIELFLAAVSISLQMCCLGTCVGSQ